MDLTFDEEQLAIIGLADRILGDQCAPDVLRSLEKEAGNPWPRDAWSKLAQAGLVGIGLPEAVGGGGHGFLQAAMVVEAVARAAAPLPAYATMVLGAAPIAAFGSDEQIKRWLPGVCDASIILSGALTGENEAVPAVRGLSGADGRIAIFGRAWHVPFGAQADAIVVSVCVDGDDPVLVIVPGDTPGLTFEALAPMSGEPATIVDFDGVHLDAGAVLPGSLETRAATWLEQRALAATCVAQVGTCAGALALTAAYVSQREQFGVALATLQAVSQRAADAWIDTELIRLTAWSAAWRLDQGLEAADEVNVAKFFASEAAQRVVLAAQHLHGGIGMDLDYPVHRYFRCAKTQELRLGGGSVHLAELGAGLAAT